MYYSSCNTISATDRTAKSFQQTFGISPLKKLLKQHKLKIVNWLDFQDGSNFEFALNRIVSKGPQNCTLKRSYQLSIK